MGIFGKRKEKEGGQAAPSGGGIRDLSESGGQPQLSSDLGPPGQDTPGQAPPPPAAMMGDEEMPSGPAPMPMPMAAAPPPPMAPSAVMAAPPPPAMVAAPAPAAVMPSGDMAMSAPAPSVQAAGGLERLDNVEQRLADMSRRVDLLDRASDDIRNDISRIRDSIAQIEGDMRELTSLYDLISTQINPFIDTSTMEEKPAIAVEQGAIPDLDALFEPTPELAPGEVKDAEFAPVEGEAAAAPAGAGEAGAGEEAPAGPPKVPRLVRIGADASCHLALMEWIKYLLERVNRSELPSVLSFYQRIGWISGEIKTDMLEIIRGIGAVAGEPAAPAAMAGGPAAASSKDESGDIVIAYGKEAARDLKGAPKGKGAAPAARAPSAPVQSATWRLSPDDHVASLMYIEWIRSGGDLDRDKLEEIRREVSRLRGGLDGFFSL